MSTRVIPLHLIERAVQHNKALWAYSGPLISDMRHKSAGAFGDYIVEFEIVYDQNDRYLGRACLIQKAKTKKEKQK